MNDHPIPPAAGGQPPSQQSPYGAPRAAGASATERVQLIIEAAEQAAAGIINDAEAQARSYLEESRRRAERIAEQRAREMWGLTDDLIARAEAVRRQSDELLRALENARRAIDDALRVGPASVGPGTGATAGAPSIWQAPPAPQPPYAQQPLQRYPSQPQTAPPPAPSLRDASWQPQGAGAPPPQPGPPPQEVPPPSARPFGPPKAVPQGAYAPAGREPRQPSEGARLLATQMAVAGSTRAEIEGRLQHEFDIRDTAPILDAILGPGG